VRKASPILLAGLLVSAVPVDAAAASPPQKSVKKAKDTAGLSLRRVWSQARRKYRDAVLISISGRTGPSGVPRCRSASPFQHGWRYTFYSPKAEKFVMMAECLGKIAGPLVQMRSKSDSWKYPISGSFIDSDRALTALARAGFDLDPSRHGGVGKRPYTLQLYRLADDRFKDPPVVWRIKIGKKNLLVDAVKNEKFDPTRYGQTNYAVMSATEPLIAEALNTRPKRAGVYTALTDYSKVMEYKKTHFPQGSLMAVEGFTDAWGGSPCTGPGDGWAFYFYVPKLRNYEAVYACNGYIGPGPTRYIPVDMNMHEPLRGKYIDSDRAIDSLLVAQGDIFNEGMGRNFTRTGTLLLRRYRSSPFTAAGLWKVRLLWEITMGRRRFRMDAENGRLLDVIE
jgi:hypothetical protein